ncbi:MAG: hypothetical protein IPK82_37795 [Polyangiaceae bacterium]|nr:hypothetical protein [Polyangiaceae bacterium]
MPFSRRPLFILTYLAALSSVIAGCELVLGLEPATQQTGGAGGNTLTSSATTGGSGGTETTTSTQTMVSCNPGDQMPCYSGPPNTEGVADCKGGMTTCKPDGSGYEETCAREIVPTGETCAASKDENCDGYDCILWARTFGDENAQAPLAVESDAAGNIYVLGTFYGAIKFDATELVSAGERDFFLVKFDPLGNTQWAKQFGDAGDQTLASLGVDPSGNIVVGGKLSGTIKLGTDPIQGKDTFVGRLDADGKHVWSNGFSITNATNAEVAIQPDSTVIVWTDFVGTANLGGPILSSAVDRKAVLAALGPADGAWVWQKQFGATEGVNGNKVSVSGLDVDFAGNVTFSGDFEGKKLNLGGADVLGIQDGAQVYGGLFLARFDQFGTHAWSTFDWSAKKLAGGPSGTVFVANLWDEFGQQPCSDGKVVKYTTMAQKLWTATFHCPFTNGDVSSIGVAPSSLGELAIAFAAGDAGGYPLTFAGSDLDPVGTIDLILGKLDPDGNHLWSKRFGVPNESQDFPVITTAPNGDILLAAQVSGPINVGTGELPVPSGAKDLLIARFAP